MSADSREIITVDDASVRREAAELAEKVWAFMHEHRSSPLPHHLREVVDQTCLQAVQYRAVEAALNPEKSGS